ncbi:MAG: tRNA pseudouridine(55) synthase TruB, partial [Alphaproteobacteria bacterium]
AWTGCCARSGPMTTIVTTMARRRRGTPIDGWLVLDKPQGLTSARALARVLALTGAAKGGHAGTLDPLATGVLPIALGEATKTIAHAVAGAKRYRFTLCFGEARDTDDAEGAVVATSPSRPATTDLVAALAGFQGVLDQVPPRYSAIKRAGQRACDVARAGGEPVLVARAVRLDAATLIERGDPDHAVIELACGKGFYVRAFARDLAARLGTLGYVAALRRLACGPFTLAQAISLDKLQTVGHSPALVAHLMPIATALDDIPALPVSDEAAARIARGQAVVVPGITDGPAFVTLAGRPVALATVDQGRVRPVRVFRQES